MELSISNLNALSPDTLSPRQREILAVLLVAVNDWPSELIDLGRYAGEIEELVGGSANENNIRLFLRQCNYSLYAWQAESLSQLLDVFPFYGPNASLPDIIHDIQAI